MEDQILGLSQESQRATDENRVNAMHMKELEVTIISLREDLQIKTKHIEELEDEAMNGTANQYGGSIIDRHTGHKN